MKKTLTTKQKYDFYQNAVQAPEADIEVYDQIYRELFNKDAVSLREDFSGCFSICCEWIKSAPNRKAVAIDLDPEPLEYGRKTNMSKLTKAQQKRLTILEKDVRCKTKPLTQIIAAMNFSFFIFKKRAEMVSYFKAAHASLQKKGIIILDMVGGKGFITAPYKEKRKYQYERGPHKGETKFIYTWTHKSYNPRTKEGLYSISFRTPNGDNFPDAFVYDWRIWSYKEMQAMLYEAGFSDVRFFQQIVPGNYYKQTNKEPKDYYCWLGFMVGVK